MDFIRNCVITAVTTFCIVLNTKAQTVYYPARSSSLLKSTAEDAAMLLQKAISGSSFNTQAYNTMPSAGIIFIYDETIADNQACKVESNGNNLIKLTAAQDNGLHFGIYQYLHQLGFRFYQPGAAWEIIPALSSSYKKIDTIYNCAYKYKTWFISGGHYCWIMDNNSSFGWDTYFGENGHNWAVYQRRNGMLGSSAFSGHIELISGAYLETLKNNPCYVANYNGSRQVNSQSVPDIYNKAATDLWANTIEQKHTQYKNIIFGNSSLYINQYRNFNFNYQHIGIEVPDGANWGNSKENDVCNAVDYPKESDQQFTLANLTAGKILTKYPDKHFQVYAYSTHADVPSPSITINKNIDVQLIPTVYQLESSTNGLRNRWYSRFSNISEYQYLNLSNWSGETPSFRWNDLKVTLQIAKDKKSQGLLWEASPAKFGSLPFLLATNNYLKDDKSVDSTLHEFCNNMFAGANNTVYKILQMWGDEKTTLNKYKMQLYIRLINEAVLQTQNAPDVVKQRIRELKAYLHYMILYFDLANNDQQKMPKADKDAALCIYLAKVHKMQLVNSYYLIDNIASRYPATDNFYLQYNIINGTAYQNGNLPLITGEEIDNNFLQDVSKYSNQIEEFKLEEATDIKDRFNKANIAPLSKINARIGYTNGINYYNITAFHLIAPAAGTFSVQYTPRFDMPGKGYINFLVEAADKTLQIVKDFSLDKNSTAGTFTVNLPAAGRYILTVVSKYKSAVDLTINTNGNYFYKNGAFIGNTTESYNADLNSLPGYFYIPAGLSKIYFNTPNSISGGKYATAETISNSFNIKDSKGTLVKARLVTPKDSTFFYLEIPEDAAGTFWHVTKTIGYNLRFININNVLWYTQGNICGNTNFVVAVINVKGTCITQLTTTGKTQTLNWEVNDNGRILKYSNQAVVDLPDYISSNAIIKLTDSSNGCSFIKRLADDTIYLRAKNACSSATGAANPAAVKPAPLLFPNPSSGIFNCMQKGVITVAGEIVIYNTQGIKINSFKNVKQFNISNAPAGLYFYQIVINGIVYKGKIVKL